MKIAMKKGISLFTTTLFLVLFVFSLETIAQQKQIAKGTVQRIKVHGKELEGNLGGDSADRWVSVYLPASYQSNSSKRYPVVYFLHDYTDDDAKFYRLKKHWMALPPVLDSVFARDTAHEMIVVTPRPFTQKMIGYQQNKLKKSFRRRAAIEPVISHLKTDHRLSRNFYKGIFGDNINMMLAAAAFNFKRMMNQWKTSFLDFLRNLIFVIHLLLLQLNITTQKTKMNF